MKKRNFVFKILLMLLAGCVAIVFLWSIVNFRPVVRDGQPLVRISPETTVIDGPLDNNGDVDYLEALNLKLSDGVTAENNAAVKYIEALGPAPEGTLLDPEFFRRLNIEQPPQDGKYFVDFSTWLFEQAIRPARYVGAGYDLHETQWDFAMSAPWSAESFPELEKWFVEMQPIVEMAKEGSKRDRYYHPLIVGPDESRSLINALLPMAQKLRELARYNSISAMRNVENGDIDAAFDDLLATYKMGLHIRSGSMLVEDLIGIALQGIASEAVTTICATGKPTSKQLKDFLRKLNDFPPPSPIADSLAAGEHFMMLDVIGDLGRGKTEVFDAFQSFPSTEPKSNPLVSMAFKTVDWEECLIVSNTWYQRLIDCVKIDNFEVRNAELIRLEAELKQMEIRKLEPASLAMAVLGGRRAKGQMMAEGLICMLSPALLQVSEAEWRSATVFDRTRVVVAISAFKQDHGNFPKSLSELAPDYLDPVPLDSFSNQPFKYSIETDESGTDTIKLYSVGKDQVDDEGNSLYYNGGSGDDWPIEWTVPTWEAFEAESKGSWVDEDESEFWDDEIGEESDLPPKPRDSDDDGESTEPGLSELTDVEAER